MSNLETVQAIYAAFGAGNIPAILEHLAEDVDWEHDAVDHGVPYLRPGRGRGHVVEFFGIAGRDLAFSRFEPVNLLVGGDQVTALVHVEFTYKPTGKTLKDYEAHVWTFGKDGTVHAFRHIVDTLAHVEATRG